MKTLEEQLTEVQQAISDILLNAQEAWYNGQKVRKAHMKLKIGVSLKAVGLYGTQLALVKL